MKKFSLILATILLSYVTTAQTSGQVASYTPGPGGVTDGLYNYAAGAISDKLDKLSYDDKSIEGSPYQFNEFMPGTLYYGDEAAGDIYYRYNAYNEEVEIKQKNSAAETIRGLSKDKKIKVVTMGNKPLSFKTFITKNGHTKNGYLTLLADGNFKLYKHLNVTFKEGKKAENSFVKPIPAKFSQKDSYYIAIENRIVAAELSNKKLVQLIGGQKGTQLKQYLKQENIKIKQEEDLHKAINFLNKM